MAVSNTSNVFNDDTHEISPHLLRGGVDPISVLPLNDVISDVVNATPTNVTCSNDYCVSDEEYIDMIVSYIYPDTFEWCVIVLYVIVFMVGLIGNFLVCFIVWRNKSMQTVTNYFIVNLSVADFLVILVCLPPTVLEDVTETWYINSVMCKVIKYIQVRSSNISR
jgi:hypothetical protein